MPFALTHENDSPYRQHLNVNDSGATLEIEIEELEEIDRDG